jgi:predicted lipid-binding transport protein (Tim44 family)
MTQGVQLIDIVLFAAIAIFLVLRLRSVLGRRTGAERRRDLFSPSPESDKQDPGRGPGQDKVIALPDRGARQEETQETDAPEPALGPVEAGLARIGATDRGFSSEGFLAGARAAFETIVGAYAAGDAAALRPLLSDDVYERFAGAVRTRERAGHKLETTLVGIKEATVIEAALQDRTAAVTVKFISDQINVTRDSDGKVVEGDPTAVTAVTDLWTFTRNVRSRDPNWALVATRSPN